MYCTNCGASNSDRAQFCAKCGTSLLNQGDTYQYPAPQTGGQPYTQAYPVGQPFAAQPPTAASSPKRRALIVGVAAVATALLICIGGIAAFHFLAGGNSSTTPSPIGTIPGVATDAVDVLDYMGKDIKEAAAVIDGMPGSGPLNMGGDKYYEIHNGKNEICWELKLYKGPDGEIYRIIGVNRFDSEVDEATPRVYAAGIYPGQDLEEAYATLENSGWEEFDDNLSGEDYKKDDLLILIQGDSVVDSFNIRSMS